MAEPPDDGRRYARNMQRLTKYTKNNLCIELVFLYMITSRCRSIKLYKKKIFLGFWQQTQAVLAIWELNKLEVNKSIPTDPAIDGETLQ